MRWAVLSAALVIALEARPGTARGQEQPAENPPPSVLVRPLASLIVPGAGQLMAHQDRGAVYIAAEVYLLSRYLQLDHEALVEARRFQNLAFDVARHAFAPIRRDTIFEYYEQMERFAESGNYDSDPGPAFVPESDPATYNGSVWLLARRTFWPNPDVPPDPTSPAYWKALEFYQARAIGPNFQWSWRNHSLEHEVFKDYIKRSDNAFRRAQNQVGLLLANHVLSAVDALISARMSAIAGHGASMRTTLTPGYSEIRFSLPF
jgi:hypothetical protein